MKYSEQNIALAKLGGWVYEAPPVGGSQTADWYHPKVGYRSHIPMYVLGESVIQTLVERLLVSDDQKAKYGRILFEITTGQEWRYAGTRQVDLSEMVKVSQARCDQKAEALLRTFEKWTSE